MVEEAVDNSIKADILQRVPLHASQMSTSTETALVGLTDQIQDALANKETVVCTFLDTGGAVDNTTHEAIQKALTSCLDGCRNGSLPGQ